MKMKTRRLLLAALLLTMPLTPVGWTGMTCTQKQQTGAFQTIGATESAVLAANMAYLDSVVLGRVPTNSVPTVEASFNLTQMTLHAAAAMASGGTNAPVPATALAQATSFTNTINAVTPK